MLALPAVLLGTVLFCILSNLIMLVLGGEQYLAGSWVLVWVSPLLFFSFFGMLFGWPVLGAVGKVADVTKSTVMSAVFCITTLLLVSFTGLADLRAICIIRSLTEALLFGLRFYYALPVLRGKETCDGFD